MIRILAWSVPLTLALAAAITFFLGRPARAEEPLPYDCLPAQAADAVHAMRGDRLIAHRRQGQFMEFAWRTQDGAWLIVRFNRATLLACAMRWTEYDPRLDRSS